METKDYLKYLVEEIHTTVVATTDDSGKPVTCAVDMMDCSENSLFFLTAKGKSFYERLKKSGYVSLTGIKGDSTLSSAAISISGKVRELGDEKAKELFDKNPYMYEIYPDEASRSAIRVFELYEGSGEWFNLAAKPVERASFSLGGEEEVRKEGYFVTDKCIGCKLCYSRCPQKCIDISTKPVVIQQEHCLHCGNCFEICPMRAIVKLG